MRQCHRKHLKLHYESLVKKIEPEPLMIFLLKKDVITANTCEEIRLGEKREDMSAALLTELMDNSGLMAFKMLIEGLQNTDKASLACPLLEEEIKRLSREGEEEKARKRALSNKIKEQEKKNLELNDKCRGCDELKKQIEHLNRDKVKLSTENKQLEEKLRTSQDANAENLNPDHWNDLSSLPGNDASRKEERMDDKHRNILRHNRSAVSKDLEPKKILPQLAGVLDEQDEAEIRAKETRKEASYALLDMLPRRGQRAFALFMEALRKKQPHLAVYLDKMQTHLNHVRAETAGVRKENRELKMDLQRERESHRRTKKECDQLKSTKEISKPRKKKMLNAKKKK